MEVKPREVLLGIVILVIMLIIGSLVGNKIADIQEDRNAEVLKAVQIENDPEMFQYGMRTRVGRSFSYGTLTSHDPVREDRIEGERSYIKISHQRYTRHTRKVTKSSGSGENRKTWTETEVYWTWDTINTTTLNCNSYDFLGVNIPVDEVNLVAYSNKDGTFKTGYHKRDVIHSLPVSFDGTMDAFLDKNLTNTTFYADDNIEEVVKSLTAGGWVAIWWAFWIVLTGAAIGGFISLENYWLD